MKRIVVVLVIIGMVMLSGFAFGAALTGGHPKVPVPIFTQSPVTTTVPPWQKDYV